jgi:hypothetical protein
MMLFCARAACRCAELLQLDVASCVFCPLQCQIPFQFNYKVSQPGAVDVEYIYDLNNINLSIKHISDLFISAGCICRNIFSNICLVALTFFSNLNDVQMYAVRLMKWQIFERNQYWGIHETVESLNFCRDLCCAINFLLEI